MAATGAASRALGTSVGVGNRTVRVAVGRLVTVWLTEPEAYASSLDNTPPPTAFPWRAPQSSDPAKLSPVAVCKHPPLVTSLPVRLYPFRATSPGRYEITVPLNPAYHIPRMKPPLRPLHPVCVTVVVSSSRHPPNASPATYTVVAPVLYQTTLGTRMACLAIHTSFPPAGCSGVAVAGDDFTHVAGVVHFGAMGWETPQLRLVGTWNGHRLTLTRVPVPTTTRPEPSPPSACHSKTTPSGAPRWLGGSPALTAASACSNSSRAVAPSNAFRTEEAVHRFVPWIGGTFCAFRCAAISSSDIRFPSIALIFIRHT